jgi:hypothetical protein
VKVAERPGLLETVRPLFEEANRAWNTEMEIWQLWELSAELIPVRVIEFSSRQEAIDGAGARERILDGRE